MMTKLRYYGSVTCNAYRKHNFFITFDCLVSVDQPTINYKSRLRRNLTQTLHFSQMLILICHRSMHYVARVAVVS